MENQNGKGIKFKIVFSYLFGWGEIEWIFLFTFYLVNEKLSKFFL